MQSQCRLVAREPSGACQPAVYIDKQHRITECQLRDDMPLTCRTLRRTGGARARRI